MIHTPWYAQEEHFAISPEDETPTKFGYWNRGNQAFSQTPAQMQQQRWAYSSAFPSTGNIVDTNNLPPEDEAYVDFYGNYFHRGNQALGQTPAEIQQQRSAYYNALQSGNIVNPNQLPYPHLEEWAGKPLPPGSRTPVQPQGYVPDQESLWYPHTSEPGFGFSGAPQPPDVLSKMTLPEQKYRRQAAEWARTTDTDDHLTRSVFGDWGPEKFAFTPTSPPFTPPVIFDALSFRGLAAWAEVSAAAQSTVGNWINGIWRPDPTVYESEEQAALEKSLIGPKYQAGMPFTATIDIQRSEETWFNIGEFWSGDMSYNELLENLNNTFTDRSMVQQILADIQSTLGVGALKLPFKYLPRVLKGLLSAIKIKPTTPSLFLGTLRPFDQVMKESYVENNPVVKFIAAKTGINPSALASDTIVGRALIAFERQSISAGELAEAAVSAALDVHAQKWTGRIGGLLPIDKDGFFGKTGKLWQTVFSNPGKYPSLDLKTREYIADFNQVIREVEAIRIFHGLTPRNKMGLGPGEYYVPRQVESVRGVQLEGLTNPNLQRIYEEAEEGFANGVRYHRDPRATLKLHVSSAYREVTEKQLSDAMESLSFLPMDIADPILRQQLAVALNAKNAALNAKNVAKKKVDDLTLKSVDLGGYDIAVADKGAPSARVGMGGTVTPEAEGLRAQIKPGLDKALDEAKDTALDADEVYDGLKATWDAEIAKVKASNIYTADRDGALWGLNQGETIKIDMWTGKKGNFKGRFFSRDDYKLLEAGLKQAEPLGLPMQVLKTTGDSVRFLATVGDFALPFTHGLIMLARDPEAWGNMAFRHYQSFFDPTVQARLIRERIGTYQKMAQNGIPIGDPEFFAIMREGESFSPGKLLELLPKGEETRRLFQQAGRQTFGRFQSSYNAGLGSARALLWESLEASWKGTDAELAQYIRNMTGGLDSRALGIGPGQRVAEGMWLAFSPRLLRSTVALMNDALGGAINLAVPGRRASAVQVESLRSMAQLVSGVTATYVMTGLALGKSWDEIKTGLNPLSGKKFLSHQINGDWIGVGGQVRAAAQFLAQMYSTLAPGGKPLDDLLATNQFDNPFIGGYMSRAAPAYNIAGGAVEAFTGLNVLPFKNIDSLPDLAFHIGTSAFPFTLAGRLEGEEVLTSVASLLGLRTSAETLYEKRDRAREEVAMELGFAAPYTLAQQREINAAPRLEVIMERIRELNEESQNPVATYIRDTEEVRGTYEGEVSKIVEFFDTQFDDDDKVFTGKDFRRQLREFQGVRSDSNKKLRESDTGKEALEIFKSEDKVQHIESVALADYYTIVFADPPLDNETSGTFNHAEWERRNKVWEGKYDPGTIQNVLTHMRLRNHPRVQELYADQDSPVMKEYWDVADAVIENAVRYVGPAVRAEYENYLAAHPVEKSGLRENGKYLKDLLRIIGNDKEYIRCGSEDLERKLLRWGYVTAPIRYPDGRQEYCHPQLNVELRAARDRRDEYKASRPGWRQESLGESFVGLQ